MRKVIVFILFLVSTLGFSQNQSIGFIENKGQIIDQYGKSNNKVKYLLNTPGLNVQLRENGFSYDVYEVKKHPLKKEKKISVSARIEGAISNEPNYKLEYTYHRIDIDFENSNKAVQLIGEGKSTDYDNYYNVPNKPNGITNVHKYQRITYKNIYSNIDVVFFIPEDKSKPVEYNFVIHQGGKLSDIQLKFEGVTTELVDHKIKMNVRFGEMEETIPMSWVENGTDKKDITMSYKKIRKNVFGFESSEILTNKTIIIDPVPVRLWGTFYGGERDEYNKSLEKDSNENVYLCGSTSSKDFIATSGAHQTIFGSINYYSPSLYITDGYIAKFDANGNKLWSTFYGGTLDDSVNDIAISSNNAISFCGDTWSNSNIATPNSFKDFKSGVYGEMFFGLLNPDGTRIWCTYFGDNSGRNFMNAITFDNNDNIYVAGTSSSTGYIATSNGFKTTPPTSVYDFDGFVSKFSITGNQIWGTYYGGINGDFFEDIIFDHNNNNIIAVGYTNSTAGIASSNSFQQSLADLNNLSIGNDGFIVNFTKNGIRNWGTYFGGNKLDEIWRVKSFNNFLYISGKSNSDNLATANAFESNQSWTGVSFIAKFDMINQQKVWFSYSAAEITDIDVNPYEEIYIVGESTYQINNLSTQNAFNSTPNGFGSYIRKLNNNCQIVWGTYLGNNGFISNPYVKHIINDSFYISGTCWALNLNINYGLTTTNSFQEFSKDGHESYINKFRDCQSSITASSNTPTCVGSNLSLTASGGTNYTWIGPNGFTSNIQNPIIVNATTLNSGQYSCTITGAGGCDDTITMNVLVGDTTKPVPNSNPLPTITGDCNTTIPIPTATDNCSGNIIATTTDPLTYSLLGSYTINWTYDDGNGNIETQIQNVVITAVVLPVSASPQSFCIQQNATINDIAITGQNIQWYDAQLGGNLLNSNTPLVDGATYYASQTINGCESERVPITITIYNTPTPTASANQGFCSTQNATLSDIVISGSTINWYDDATLSTTLPSSTLLQNNVTYYATQTLNGCESTGYVAVTINLINTLNASNYSEIICDDLNDGSENINLNNYTNLLISGTGNTFTFYNSQLGAQNQNNADLLSSNYSLNLGSHTIYVRIDSANSCYQIVTLTFELVAKPIITIKDIMPICLGTSITVNAGNGFDSYLWSTNETTPSIIINQSGNYNVTVTQNHGTTICSSTKNFTVVNSSVAEITEIITTDWDYNSITVMISANSSGDYEYSLDNVNFQDSNSFDNLPSGIYTVYIRDKNGCGTISEEVYLLTYPKYFTPNGDGIHDFWKIKFSELEPNLTIKLFDRYGKLLQYLEANSDGWDGTLHGEKLPADDYWFVVVREDGLTHKGHFALKR